MKDVVLCTGYLGTQLLEYCGDGSRFGLNLKYSFNFGDISFSKLGAYDRLPNLSGLTVYTDESFLGTVFSAVPRWSYRYTDVYNIGSVLLFDDFTLRID